MKFIPLRRKYFSLKHIHSGSGIEIGALTDPLPVHKQAQVKYLDWISTEDLKKTYPEIANRNLVHVNFIDDGETLSTIPNESQDFLIANHFLEHTENPLGTLLNFLRVLKPGGLIYLAIPDRRATFDQQRPLTPTSHFIEVFEAGCDRSRIDHYCEYAALVENLSGDQQTKRVQELSNTLYKIHFHTFQTENFIPAIRYLHEEKEIPIQLEALLNTEFPANEFIILLRKGKKPQNRFTSFTLLSFLTYFSVAMHLQLKRIYITLRSRT